MKRKIELKRSIEEREMIRRDYRKTIPLRLLKASLGVLMLPFIFTIAFAAEAYRQNKWPWGVM